MNPSICVSRCFSYSFLRIMLIRRLSYNIRIASNSNLTYSKNDLSTAAPKSVLKDTVSENQGSALMRDFIGIEPSNNRKVSFRI